MDNNNLQRLRHDDDIWVSKLKFPFFYPRIRSTHDQTNTPAELDLVSFSHTSARFIVLPNLHLQHLGNSRNSSKWLDE